MRKNGPVHPSRPLSPKNGFRFPQLQQVFVELIDLAVMFAFGKVQSASLEGPTIGRIEKNLLAGRQSEARELAEEFAPALGHQGREFRIVVGKEKERRRCCEFLALKKHGSARRQQRERRQGFITARARELVNALTSGGIGDLVVILQKHHEPCPAAHRAKQFPAALLPFVMLSLQVSPLTR